MIRHVYWLTEDEDDALWEDMKARSVRMNRVKDIVCKSLAETGKISNVAPEVWNSACARQGSWYRASDRNGLHLVVSPFELEDYAEKRAATISPSEFDPPRLATRSEKGSLAGDPEFADRIPPEWERIDEKQKKTYLRWARRLGSRTDDYEFLYLTHTANHANFLKPRFFIEKDRTIVPYSIDRSAHLCSSCLEYFQVLGTLYPEKLVAPCPGAAAFAGLKPDRYLLVART